MYDILLKGGDLVDGTGEPKRRADIAIKGDRIVAIGEITEGAERVIDCEGLVVAPGTIDIHTHLDAQILWDPELTPSSSFGVTTVVMGNCGLSIAPLPSEQRERWIGTLARVEAMPTKVLKQAIRWEFETYEEYFSAIERFPLTLNVGGFVGHTAIRMTVMGSDTLREARPDEIKEIRRVLRESLEAGALGFSTSKAAGHIGADGNHVPSWYANVNEMYEMAEELGSLGRGVIQQQTGLGYSIPEFCEMARRSGRPITWTALHGGMIGSMDLFEQSVAAQEKGLMVIPQIGVMPTVAQFTLRNPYLFKVCPAWASLREDDPDTRKKAYADPTWRAKALQEMTENREGRGFDFRWPLISIDESPSSPELKGKSIAQIVKERGGHESPIDVLVALALKDNLMTRIEMVLYDHPVEDTLFLKSNATIIGASDAGAHASQMCNAAYGPYLIAQWVRKKGILPLEYAVWRLSGQPAEFLGLKDRGHLKTGYFADIWVFNPDTVDSGPIERVYDLPTGADRLIRHASGIEHVLVNGECIITNGARAHAHPGRVLRGC
jgi:N-acyl-D-amino-acid deacylase